MDFNNTAPPGTGVDTKGGHRGFNRQKLGTGNDPIKIGLLALEPLRNAFGKNRLFDALEIDDITWLAAFNRLDCRAAGEVATSKATPAAR